ncbi:sugar ABC transporter substrate-binding protein [Roseimarinus sediminis]|jgi:D-xylose transport system substrate-binding protein|uniref:sugar ABC transporter substrate-binding protein n=1 Tax=Roseimarinus sediminis TaxID=1610899 RepID=UPI003D220872
MMKQIVKLGMFAVMLFLLSCSGPLGNSKDVKIGFLIHSTTSSRWQMDIAYVKERAEQIGATIVLKDAEGDENMQLKQASELLLEGVDALIVVAANQNTAAGIVREAHTYDVPVIAYDRLIKNSDLDYLVSFEYEKVGRLMVEYVEKHAPNGNCIILWGDASDANAVFVKNGHEKTIESSDVSMNYVYRTYVEGWTYTNAKHQMDKILDFYPEKIDAVIACNDPLGLGAYDALIEHGYQPGEVIITGQDATLEFMHSMLNDGMTMSVSKPIKDLAYGAVDLVVGLVSTGEAKGFDKSVNNGRKDVPARLFEPLVVDRSNFEQQMIGGGVYTREQVFGKQ